MRTERVKPEKIARGYECPSHSLCKASWELREPEKWSNILQQEKDNDPFSYPLAPYQGEYYRCGGIMIVSINFNYRGDGWDARQGPVEKDRRLSWRSRPLFANAGKFIGCLFKVPNRMNEVDKHYAFANIVKCSPNSGLSRRSWPSQFQFQQCISVHRYIWHEIEELNPGIVICLGHDAYNCVLTQYTEKRYNLHQKEQQRSLHKLGVTALDEDTIAIRLPHLSGGMRSINTMNKRFREEKIPIDHIPSLRGLTYDKAKANLDRENAVWFDDNIILTATAFDMAKEFIQLRADRYQQLRNQFLHKLNGPSAALDD